MKKWFDCDFDRDGEMVCICNAPPFPCALSPPYCIYLLPACTPLPLYSIPPVLYLPPPGPAPPFPCTLSPRTVFTSSRPCTPLPLYSIPPVLYLPPPGPAPPFPCILFPLYCIYLLPAQALTGKTSIELLECLMMDQFICTQPPKSTGREVSVLTTIA